MAAHGKPLRPAGVPWTVRDVWVGVLDAALIVAGAWVLSHLFHGSLFPADPNLWIPLVPTSLELLLLVPVWWFAIHKYRASLETLGFGAYGFTWVAAGFGLLILFYGFNIFYSFFLHELGQDQSINLAAFFHQYRSPWPLFIITVIVAPVTEEIFFRGFVFAGLRSRYNWHVAALISAALAAIAHVEIAFFVPIFVLGYLFAFLYQKSNSLWPGLMVHMFLSALALIVPYVVT
jgi:membrane protease YdiL (CAAX protease family)